MLAQDMLQLARQGQVMMKNASFPICTAYQKFSYSRALGVHGVPLVSHVQLYQLSKAMKITINLINIPNKTSIERQCACSRLPGSFQLQRMILLTPPRVSKTRFSEQIVAGSL